MPHTLSQNKGFTLVELLVVIAIVAVLSTVVIITLNPAELLRQTRDSTRISDMATMKSAIALYLADVLEPDIGGAGAGTTCYVSAPPSTPAMAANCGGAFPATVTMQTQPTDATTARKVDSNGWIPVNFTTISAGTPLGSLPIDPVNNATYFYAYAANASLQYEIDAVMESTRYNSGTGNVMDKDGGDVDEFYEVGTNLEITGV